MKKALRTLVTVGMVSVLCTACGKQEKPETTAPARFLKKSPQWHPDPGTRAAQQPIGRSCMANDPSKQGD